MGFFLAPTLQAKGSPHQSLFFLLNLFETVTNAMDVVTGGALGLVRKPLDDSVVEP